ncbi:uncharacterized protein LOC110448560 [Mizuhopecten yessoensis]|uniref:uncharacterized protein LOC110448560 n=1 Tax=Mizuhopecten yessoensis TaxID=6573 RepID=UPI000B45B436|nr:uncharacterized protein LOC110448560 [Mizuhopecten yessoensis]
MATDCCFAILCRMVDSFIDRTWRFCCSLVCCNCECPCCSTNQCQEMTCRFHFCEPELDEDYEPGNIQEVKVTTTPVTYTCEDLDAVCLVCCRYLSCVPCCAFMCKKCSNSRICPKCLHSNCCLAKDRNILKEMEVLENSIPGAYKKSSTPQKKGKDSHLYPKESTGKTHLVSTDNNSVYGNDSKTSSLRSKAESEEEEMNREDGHYRSSDKGKNETTITAIIEHPPSVALCGTTDSVTIAHNEVPTSSGTATKSIQYKTRKLARKMDSIEFDQLLDSDSENDHDQSCYHGNKATPNVKVNYRDVCTNGVQIIVTDYDYGKKRTDSISSESSVDSRQMERNQEIVEQEKDSSSESADTPIEDQCSEDMQRPVVMETRNILITNHRQTSV